MHHAESKVPHIDLGVHVKLMVGLRLDVEALEDT